MGYYLEVPRHLGKVQQLLDGHLLVPVNGDPANPFEKFSRDMQWDKAPAYEAEIIDAPPAWEDIPDGKALVVVVDNGLFEAAAVAYDEREHEALATQHAGDDRHRTYMLIDKNITLRASGAPGGATPPPAPGPAGFMAGLLAMLSRLVHLFG
jgi:hypothetical protein